MAAQSRPGRTLARCLFKACPVRFASGKDRMCAEHGADDGALFRAMAELGIERVPGDRSDGPGAADGGR